MAKKRAARKKKSEDVIETGDDFIEQPDGDLDFDGSEDAPKAQTFAESAGTPANAHAKELAKKESAAKKHVEPSASFYTLKGLSKVIKTIVKQRGVFEVYVGNKDRHEENLKVLIESWKKQGLWLEPHQVKEKILAIRANLPKEKRK